MSVYPEVRVYTDPFEGLTVQLTELRGLLAAAHSQYEDLVVTVRGDGLTHYQNVAAVMTACRQAGISEMGIAVIAGDGAVKER
jgi:biopolymer transport protein ExbD